MRARLMPGVTKRAGEMVTYAEIDRSPWPVWWLRLVMWRARRWFRR